MIHLDPKQINATSREMYGIFRSIVKQSDPTAQIKPWSKHGRIFKVAWDEVAIWHLRKTGEIKERRT